MNCRDALKVLYEYLDSQLDNATSDDVKKHLAQCKHCFDTYQFEQNLNKIIKQKASNEKYDRIEQLKMKVKAQINDLERSASDKENRAGFFRFRPVLAVSFMAIVAVIALTLFLSQNNNRIMADILDIHDKAITGTIPMDIVTQDLHILDSCLSNKMDIPENLMFADSKCFPSRAAIRKNSGRSYAHIIYNISGSDVSLFVEPKDSYNLPKEVIEVEGKPGLYSYQDDGKNALLWQCHGYWCIAVGEIGAEKLMGFISQLH
jgi:anti-sigma factor (TIGR02949 family)